MKTILVIYTNSKITNNKDICKAKKYSFNTDSNVEVGDMIKSLEYDTSMQIVNVLDKSYKYFNTFSGELSDEFNSTSQWYIRTIQIVENSGDIIMAHKIN